ncbi:hypothetical protein P0136_00550 [Lentisphaerota bacterium ZTH]|nr:hypothetical protein JYG24_08305 [Lentisphaerota bacterium]WET06504.1 hypothetical protein P0136_00550 [Lentisphaerota bacterium ZTH]
MNGNDFYKVHNWYPELAGYALLTSFVKLRPEEITALAEGITKGPEVAGAVKRLKQCMANISGSSFVSADVCSPTDTERFAAKHGAVHSARSAWRFLAKSEKVQHAAASGEFEYLVVRPYRRMNQTREFRLFIRDGELKGMSQYWLIRHFRRLEGIKEKLWQRAEKFFDEISWCLPEQDLVMDIYITSDDQVILVDINKWGGSTDPLLFRKWDRDWSETAGIVLMPSPTKIFGNVNVSF